MDDASREKNLKRIAELTLSFTEEYPANKISKVLDVKNEDCGHYICDNESTLQYIQACQAFNRLWIKAAATAGTSLASGGVTIIPGALWVMLKASDLTEAPRIYHLIKTIGMNKTFRIGWTKTRGNRILGQYLYREWDELQRLLAFEGEPPVV